MEQDSDRKMASFNMTSDPSAPILPVTKNKVSVSMKLSTFLLGVAIILNLVLTIGIGVGLLFTYMKFSTEVSELQPLLQTGGEQTGSGEESGMELSGAGELNVLATPLY